MKRRSRSASGAGRSARPGYGTCSIRSSTTSAPGCAVIWLRPAVFGELADGLDLDFATHQLVVLIDGLSAERVLYPGRVAPQRQVCMLDHLLDSFRAASS